MNNLQIKYIFLLIILSAVISFSYGKNAKPINLKSEFAANPIGLNPSVPRLSWEINNDKFNSYQYAYQIFISKDSNSLLKNENIIWDSKKVISNQTQGILPDIKIEPNTRYYWRVRYWDNNNIRKQFSKIAFFETGMESVWKGDWITDEFDKEYLSAPIFRKEFEVLEKIKFATAHICGLGYYELYLNGDKVGNHILDPGFTRYDKKALAVSYDISNYLSDSTVNTIGVMLGNGWFNIQSHAVWNFHKADWRSRPSFIMNILVEYESGKTTWIVSDSTWKTSIGPITFNNLYSGEYYDARKDKKNWNTTGYDDSKWKNTTIIGSPTEKIINQINPPIRIRETIRPVNYKMIGVNRYVFDFGKNIAGICKLTCEGMTGTKVKMKHGEKLYPDGSVNLSNIDYFFNPQHQAEDFQTDMYILKGDGIETYMPRFTYHGFQYVEVFSDKPISLDANSLEAVAINTDLKSIGSFESSNPILDKIYKATQNSYLGNLHGIPTDCPTREKNGWTGDAHVAMEFGLLNYDAITFYEKWIRDIFDAQKESGVIPDIVPTGGWGYPGGNPFWDLALFLMPYELMMYSGDSTIAKESYEYQKKYLKFIQSKTKDYLLNFGLWDWSYYKTNTPVEFTSSVCYFLMAKHIAISAGLFNAKNELEKYHQLAEKIRNSINEKYYNYNNNTYANSSQTAQAFALWAGVVPDGDEKKVAAVLAEKITQNNYFLDFGLIGSKTVLNVLSDFGYHEIAYKMVVKEEPPSWGWWIVEKNATTLWETWKEDGSASLNHVFLGEVSAWMTKHLGGINYDSEFPGFKIFLIKPKLIDDLQSVKTSYCSVNGKIVSNWEKSDDGVVYDLVIPANTSAKVILSRQINNNIVLLGDFKSSAIKYDEGKDNYTIMLPSGSYKIITE